MPNKPIVAKFALALLLVILLLHTLVLLVTAVPPIRQQFSSHHANDKNNAPPVDFSSPNANDKNNPSLADAAGGISLMSAFDCAALPPALWCAKFVRSKCGTIDLCTKHDDTVRYKPLHITLLYESLCPYCQLFIKDTLFDVYNRFRSHIKLELIPYGNAKTNGTNVSCQHGADECRINKFQSCAITYMQDPVPFVYCLETLLYEKVTFEAATKLCFNLVNPGKYVFDRISQCFDGSEGDTLQGIAAQQTQMVWPNKHQFVPWILVNNVSIESMQFLRYSLPSLICESRADGEYVAECESD